MKKGLINIHIITTNNIKGAMFQENNAFNIYKAATYIKLARQSGQVLLINNGQLITGSPVSEYYAGLKEYKRIPLISLMNLLKYNATNITIKDFSLGFNYFNRAHAMSEFPFLSCNILNESTKEPYFNTPYIIHQYKGIKIGVIALSEAVQIDHETMIVSNPKESIKTWMRYMYDNESPDYVVALHNGQITDLITSEEILCVEGIHLLLTNNKAQDIEHEYTEIIHLPESSSLLHIKLMFKERTNSFENKGFSYEFIDVSRYEEDYLLKETIYYEEKEYLLVGKKKILSD